MLIIGIDLSFCSYNLTKFVRFHKAQSVSMCKVDHQALSYVKVLSETHLLLKTPTFLFYLNLFFHCGTKLKLPRVKKARNRSCYVYALKHLSFARYNTTIITESSCPLFPINCSEID